MRRLAAPSPRDWLDVFRPTPSWLEHQPSDLAAADVHDLSDAGRERPRLVRLLETPVLGLLLHHWLRILRLDVGVAEPIYHLVDSYQDCYHPEGRESRHSCGGTQPDRCAHDRGPHPGCRAAPGADTRLQWF